jgi:hypothetical protein
MDWDGVGTFALFISSGAVGVCVIALKAYKAKLASKLEWAKLDRVQETSDEGTMAHVHLLEDQVRRLEERMDFTEKLLGDGQSGAGS